MHIKNYTLNPIFDNIGDGTHSSVNKAVDIKQNRIAALKFSNRAITQPQKDFIREKLEIATNLDHPNICKLYDAFVDSKLDPNGNPLERYVSVMAYVEGESLFDFF